MFGDNACRLSSFKFSTVNGRQLMMLSTSAIRVVKDSSVSFAACDIIIDSNTALADLI